MSELDSLSKSEYDAIIASDDWSAKAHLRAIFRRSLYAYTKAITCYSEPTNTMSVDVFKERQDWIQRIVTEVKRGLLEEPRGYIKSTGNTRSVVPWLGIQRPDERYDHPAEVERETKFLLDHPHIKGPDSRYVVAGDTKQSAAKFTGSIRRMYLSNPLYRGLFPETVWDRDNLPRGFSLTNESLYLPGRLQPDLPGPYLEAIGTES